MADSLFYIAPHKIPAGKASAVNIGFEEFRRGATVPLCRIAS
jgi:hypothetical protein